MKKKESKIYLGYTIFDRTMIVRKMFGDKILFEHETIVYNRDVLREDIAIAVASCDRKYESFKDYKTIVLVYPCYETVHRDDKILSI